MIIYLGADHRGYQLKESLKAHLGGRGYEVVDKGDLSYAEGDDYVEFAAAVAREVGKNPEDRGILVCGSGVGMDIAANKFRRIRSALAVSPEQIYAARHEDDANILALASDFTSEPDAKKIVSVFLETPFAKEERYERRIEKIYHIENTEWGSVQT